MSVPYTAHQEDARSLGYRLVGNIREALSHDTTFLKALDQSMIQTVEGTVMAVQRDNTGVNRVQVKRTGQLAAEATWYTVWAAMFVPIVTDVVRLRRLGHGAWEISGAKHAGRPNDVTIAYPTGSHTVKDSTRNIVTQVTDTHHQIQHAADGVTVVHHLSSTGVHTSKQEILHNVTGHSKNADGSLNLTTATYHRQTHNSGGYQHGFTNAGGAEQVLRTHHPTNGEFAYSPAGVVLHAREINFGHLKHSGDHIQNATLSALGVHTGPYVRAKVVAGTYSKSLNIAGVETLLHDHDGATQRIYSGGVMVGQIAKATSGTGGSIGAKQHGTNLMHLFQDDGAGAFNIQHASGSKLITHDAAIHTIHINNQGIIQHDNPAGTGLNGRMRVKTKWSGSALGGTVTQPTYDWGEDATGNFLLMDPRQRTLIKVDTAGVFTLQNYNGTAGVFTGGTSSLPDLSEDTGTLLFKNGPTVVTAINPVGSPTILGDVYHNVGTITSATGTITRTGGYHRQTHNSGGYQHLYTSAGVSTEKLLRTHHPVTGHAIYNAAGTTVVHHHNTAGQGMHTGDVYHTVSAINADGTLPSLVAYWRMTHQNGQHELRYSSGSGVGVEMRVKGHAPGTGHFIYAGIPGDTTSAPEHAHVVGGHVRHKGEHVMNATLDAAGTATGNFVRAIVSAGTYSKRMNIAGVETSLHSTDGVTHTIWSNNRIAHQHGEGSHIASYQGVVMFGHNLWSNSANAGSRVFAIQQGTGGAPKYHLVGDDGAGKPHIADALHGKVWHYDSVLSEAVAFLNSVPAIKHKLDNSANNSAHIQLRNGAFGGSTPSTAAYHKIGDIGENQLSIHVQNVVNATTLGPLLRALNHDGTTHTNFSGGLQTHQLSASGSGGKVRMMNQARTGWHEQGEDGANKFYASIANAAGLVTKVLDHDGLILQHYANNVAVHRIRYAAANNGGYSEYRNGATAAYHTVGDLADAQGFSVVHSSGNKVLGHTGATFTGYANGLVGWTHDGTTKSIYSQGVAVARHLFAGNGGQTQVLNQARTGWHSMGEDTTNKFYASVANAAGTVQRVLDHDGTALQHYARGTAVHKIQGFAANNSGYSEYRNGTSALWHQFGDMGDALISATHSSGNRAWDHDGTTKRIYSQGVVVVRHVFAGAGGQTQVLNQARTGWHVFGEDSTNKLRLQIANAAGVVTNALDHDGLILQHYANNVAVHRIRYAAANNGGYSEYRNGATAAYHILGDIADGKGLSLIHSNTSKALDYDGTVWQAYSKNPDGVSAVHLRNNGASHVFSTWNSGTGTKPTGAHANIGTAGGQWSSQQNNTPGSYHIWGDDGTGKVYVAHANGNRVVDHDSVNTNMYAGASPAQLSYTGNGATHAFHSNGLLNRAIIQNLSNSTQMKLLRANTPNYHISGDDTLGNMHAQSDSGSVMARVSGGASAHTFQAGAHIHPASQIIDSSINSSELRIKGGGGAGAVKVGSHSVTQVPNQVSTGTVTNTGNYTVTYGSTGVVNDLHFKVVSGFLWDTNNPGDYGHNISHPGVNGGYGGSTWSGGVFTANTTWSTPFLSSKGSMQIVAKSSVGFSGALTVNIHIVN